MCCRHDKVPKINSSIKLLNRFSCPAGTNQLDNSGKKFLKPIASKNKDAKDGCRKEHSRSIYSRSINGFTLKCCLLEKCYCNTYILSATSNQRLQMPIKKCSYNQMGTVSEAKL